MCVLRRSRPPTTWSVPGLFHEDTETPEDYRPLLEKMHARGLFMVCGNPDVVVERGETLLYCAGAIADLYAKSGGEVLYAGKPYAPIYDLALKLAQDMRDMPIDKKRVLAIGDSVRTDFTGCCDLRHRLSVRYRRHPLRRIRRTRGPRPECGRARVDRGRRQAARDCAQADVVNF